MNYKLRDLHQARVGILLTVLMSIAACSKGDTAANGSASQDDASENVAASGDVKTQPFNPDPCAWVSQAEVESLIGKLDRAPARNHDGQELKPDPEAYAGQDFAALFETMALLAGVKLESENKQVSDGLEPESEPQRRRVSA